MKYFTIAQITDLHVGRAINFPSGEVKLFDQLVKTVKHINNSDHSIDLVAVTGDLVNHGHLDDYNKVKRELDKLKCPYIIVVGNHDQRQTLRQIFHEHNYLSGNGEFIQYTIEDKPVRIIALDTLEPGTHYGLICEKRLNWLDEKLQEQPGKPTLILMHHPPFETGMPYPDNLGMRGKKEFGALIARNNQIVAIASGHTHRDSVIGWKGTVVYITPSSAFSYSLEFNEVDDLDPLQEPPAYRIFRWDPAIGLVSHLDYIGNYEFGLSEGVPKPPEN